LAKTVSKKWKDQYKATTGLALRILSPLKHHYYDKVEAPVPTPLPNHQNLDPLINPPHLQHDTSYAPNSKYNKYVDFYTDTSHMENDKENTDVEKQHKHRWQHVKKRK
jgi:hypothetical protein